MSNRTRRKLQRLALALVLALGVAKVLPAIADAINGSGGTPTATVSADPSNPLAPAPTASTSASPSTSPTAPAVIYPSATITYKMDMSDTSTPTVIDTGTVTLHVPPVIKVDPRALSVAVSPIYISSTHKLLVCIAATKAQLQGIAPSSALIEDSSGGYEMLSGSGSDLMAALSPLRLAGTQHVAGSSLSLKVVAVSKANANPDFCGTPNAVSTTQIQALGLGVNTVKVPVPLK